MSTIDANAVSKYSLQSFADLYKNAKKPMIFFDTCSLLDFIRFIYRANDGINTLMAIQAVSQKIQSDEIYSVASELFIKEWNDNVDSAMQTTSDSFNRTSEYFNLSAEVINTLMGQNIPVGIDLASFKVEDWLLRICSNIISKIYFIEQSAIASAALTRVANKIAPASKKQEFKDCAIWETMLALCSNINARVNPTTSPKKIFFTTNIEDFVDKAKMPKDFYTQLQGEASSHHFQCCYKVTDVKRILGI